MNPSANCIALIKRFEGFSAKPYLCPSGVQTIGFGSTRYVDGSYVHLNDIEIDEKQATAIMLTTLKSYASDVSRYVKVKINQNQFDALVDFAYNCGSKNLLNSTLLRKINEGNFVGAAFEFGKWVRGNNIVLQGLVNRRYAEKQLFETPVQV